MSAGKRIYDAGEAMSPRYDEVIKTCAVAIAPPALVFGLDVQTMATSVYRNQCNPGDVMKAGGAWIKLGEKHQEAAEALRAKVDSVNDDNWKGDDAEAFKEAAANVMAQLKQLAATSFLIGAQLVTFAVMLTVYWSFLAACAAAMDAYLIAYLTALAGVLTAPGAPAILTGAQTTAAALVASMKSIEGVLTSIANASATLSGGLTGFTVTFQKVPGNPTGSNDIAGTGIADMLEGLADYALRASTKTPGGDATADPGTHAAQGAPPTVPIHWGDREWEDGYSGGRPLRDVPDGLRNLWDDHAPDAFTNPDETDRR